jgi:KaiC/GvpD/RAD55 family RecA-like ATPase
VFVTLETRPNELRSEADQFGWNLRDLEEKNALVIIAEEIYRAIDETKAKRLVIDCISGLGIRFSEPSEVRNELFRISALLRELQVTSLFISEIIEPDSQSRAGVEQFVTQGLITLNLSDANGALKRDLLVWKMKRTPHSLKKHAFKIGKSGIEIATKKKSRTKNA